MRLIDVVNHVLKLQYFVTFCRWEYHQDEEMRNINEAWVKELCKENEFASAFVIIWSKFAIDEKLLNKIDTAGNRMENHKGRDGKT